MKATSPFPGRRSSDFQLFFKCRAFLRVDMCVFCTVAGGGMSVFEKVLDEREVKFSQRLRSEHSAAPVAREVLQAEDDLGAGAIAYKLSATGKRLLFRALDLERKAKLRANDG